MPPDKKTFKCPLGGDMVNPAHCENKRNARPIIGMKDLFALCRDCDVQLPTSKTVKHTVRYDSPIAAVGQIEKGVKMPLTVRKGKAGFLTYPFDDMAVGDSFEVYAHGNSSPRKASNTLTSAVQHYVKKHPEKKFETRQTTVGARIWRVK